MCALRTHNSKLILEKGLSGIEKVLTTFLIPNKTFPKMDLLMCALRAHINRTLFHIVRDKMHIYIYIYISCKDTLLVRDAGSL